PLFHAAAAQDQGPAALVEIQIADQLREGWWATVATESWFLVGRWGCCRHGPFPGSGPDPERKIGPCRPTVKRPRPRPRRRLPGRRPGRPSARAEAVPRRRSAPDRACPR